MMFRETQAYGKSGQGLLLGCELFDKKSCQGTGESQERDERQRS